MKKTDKQRWANTKEKYNTESKCEKLFLTHLWPDDIKCQKCGHFNKITNKIHANKQKTFVEFKCQHCGKKIHKPIDCIFTGSTLSFKTWFKAVYYIAIKEGSTASTEFVEEFNITQKTAWKLFIRISQLAKQDIKLSGYVEIDEWYENGDPKYKHNSQQSIYGSNKGYVGEATAVLGLVERPTRYIDENGKIQTSKSSRIVLRVLDIHGMRSVDAETTKKVLDEFTLGPTKTMLYSDKAKIYESKMIAGEYMVQQIPHNITKNTKIRHDEKFVKGDIYTNNVEGLFSKVSNYLSGTHNKITFKHAQKYLDMFCFRWNNKDLTTEEKIHKFLSRLPEVKHKKVSEFIGPGETGRISQEERFFAIFHKTLVPSLEYAPINDLKVRNDYLKKTKSRFMKMIGPDSIFIGDTNTAANILKKVTNISAPINKIKDVDFAEFFSQEYQNLPWNRSYVSIKKNLDLRIRFGQKSYDNKQIPGEELRLQRRKNSKTYTEKQKLLKKQQNNNGDEKFEDFLNKSLSSNKK